jgi:hypothetical protein
MISISSIKTALKLLPLSKELKSKIEENSEIILDFQKFLSNKHSMSLKEVDGYIQTSISSKISEFDSILDLTYRASEVTYDFAVSEGYNRATELKMAIVELSESLKSIY